jgi:hypothetical protein
MWLKPISKVRISMLENTIQYMKILENSYKSKKVMSLSGIEPEPSVNFIVTFSYIKYKFV